MSAQSLTAKYRPQRFSDVAGQEAIKRILSKASAEDKIAPAYLFSGTRGVGKTTLARVLAKALNCVTAPTGEPCNECSQCRQITAGVSPDVIEIDAATHGTVDEARRLKEDIGYAPLQSRYKVFIIDEAHMLSKAAFNALLKTLEEPPGRVTFILATTEPHKILPTIISRCQHYVFKRLMQPELEAHLTSLLDREGMGFEPSAVSLIARRGAGSVRDSMSLLAQVLAMGGPTLLEQDVRDVLGLAGQDVFFSFMRSFKEQDCLGVSGLLRQVLDRGLDIGFFLRELASCWRNMFLLNQSGEKALPALELTEEEGGQWLSWAREFEARHIHACWQMTLEGQRRVMTSLEPALALELLLLNLAYIPKLLSLEAMNAGSAPRPGLAGSGGTGGAPRPAPLQPGQTGQPGQGYAPAQRPAPYGAPAQAQHQPGPGPAGAPYGAPPQAPRYAPPQGAAPGGAPYGAQPQTSPRYAPPQGAGQPASRAPQPAPYGAPAGENASPGASRPAPYAAPASAPGGPRPHPASGQDGQGSPKEGPQSDEPPPWREDDVPAPAAPSVAPPSAGTSDSSGTAPHEASGRSGNAAPGLASSSAGQAHEEAGTSSGPGMNGSFGGPGEPGAPGMESSSAGSPPWEQDEDASPPEDQEYAAPPLEAARPLGPPTWKGFVNYAMHEVRSNPLLKVAFPQMTGAYDAMNRGGTFRITCKNEFQANQIKGKPENLALLQRLANAYFGTAVTLELAAEQGQKLLSQKELRAKAEQSDLFKEARESMGAYIIDVRAKN
ncbi:DNA polymerase III subunit gamma/tau [Fundidesulfovibrio terrae]|uniref:DNA polymerase III subunit gamma/tau n=1 Tax=Fundidesulfovibrio terrae TaxID=2922866 RepID=UPI001FAEC0C1|nr:DNA polymerase III subunit gamma/tau [Fundidesulfovibrio terrae]